MDLLVTICDNEIRHEYFARYHLLADFSNVVNLDQRLRCLRDWISLNEGSERHLLRFSFPCRDLEPSWLSLSISHDINIAVDWFQKSRHRECKQDKEDISLFRHV